MGRSQVHSLQSAQLSGAGLGAMAGPSARYYMGKLVGSKQAEPTMAEANREGNIGAFTEAVGPVASKVAGKAANTIIDPLVGESDLGQVGTDAAQATEQANLADKQKLQEAATKEATKQKRLLLLPPKHRDRPNLAQRADAAKVTVEKQAGFQQAQETVKAKADADFEKQGKKLREQIVPEARQETVAGALGKTPEQTRDDSIRSERATDEAKQREIIFQKSNAAGGEFNKEYEDVRGQFRDKPANLTNTAAKAQELEQAAQANNWQLSRVHAEITRRIEGNGTAGRRFQST